MHRRENDSLEIVEVYKTSLTDMLLRLFAEISRNSIPKRGPWRHVILSVVGISTNVKDSSKTANLSQTEQDVGKRHNKSLEQLYLKSKVSRCSYISVCMGWEDSKHLQGDKLLSTKSVWWKREHWTGAGPYATLGPEWSNRWKGSNALRYSSKLVHRWQHGLHGGLQQN